MSDTEKFNKYFIYQCGYPECNKDFPIMVEFQKQDGNWNNDYTIIQGKVCPHCKLSNTITLKTCKKEITKSEYESSIKVIEETEKLIKEGKTPFKSEWK